MSQTSGSLTIDTSSLASAIVKGLTPVLDSLHTSLSGLAVGLNPAVQLQDAVEAVSDALPDVVSTHPTKLDLAEHIVHRLAESGYLLVHAPVPDLAAEADQQADQLAKEAAWFDR